MNTRDLHAASLSPAMKAFVERWAAHTGAESVQVVSAADDARLGGASCAASAVMAVRDRQSNGRQKNRFMSIFLHFLKKYLQKLNYLFCGTTSIVKK